VSKCALELIIINFPSLILGDIRYIANCKLEEFRVRIQSSDPQNIYTEKVDFDEELVCLYATVRFVFLQPWQSYLKYYVAAKSIYMQVSSISLMLLLSSME
jgi:hypothetical protein